VGKEDAFKGFEVIDERRRYEKRYDNKVTVYYIYYY